MNNETAMDKTLLAYANPTMIQASALDRLSEQVLGGEPVVDGNNVFTFLNEFNAQCTAGFANAVSDKFKALYPVRAQTFDELYGHMSDWDFEGLYAYPSTTKIQVAFDRKFLIDNAVRVDMTDYFKIVLPEFSTFTIGEYKFGIHYPIEIQIRKSYVLDPTGMPTTEVDYDACNITTQWDLSNSNPLCSYDTNILEHRTYTSGGLSFLCIEIPVYQFVITTHIDDAISNTGYLNKFDFTDKFYVLRVYQKQNDVWTELTQSYSSIVYDPNDPTALIKVYPDLNQVTVEIPQIYFDNGLVGSQLRIDIYTTKGAMNVDVSTYTKDQFSASFLLSDDRTSDSSYSDMLKRIGTCIVAPLSTRITDGNNGIDLTELKRRIVDRTEKNLLITADKITSYLQGRGFTAKNYVDNITGRYYLAERVLTDSNGIIISAGSFNTVFSSTMTTPTINSETGKYEFVNYRTFRYIDANSFMVLPNTVYKYNELSDTCTPMDNAFLDSVETMSADDKISLLNGSIYSFSPFHLKVTKSNSVPTAAYYDLLNPSVQNIVFLADGENINTNTQVSMYNHSIQHLKEGTGGYVFDILLYKTDDLKNVTPEDDGIVVLLRFLNTNGNYYYVYGKYMGISNEHDWVRFNLTTDYVIDANNRIGFTCFQIPNYTVMADLTQEFEVLFFVAKDKFTGDLTKQVYPTQLPEELRQNYIWLATQHATLKFGEPIDNLMTNVYTEAEAEVEATYPTTVFATYTDNVYYRWTQEDVDNHKVDWQGNPVTEDMIGVYKYDPESPTTNGLVITHKKGNVIISSESDVLVPIGYIMRRNFKPSINVSYDALYQFVLSSKYTQTSSITNEFVLVEYRVPTTDDLTRYHISTVNADNTESKRHQITQADVDARLPLYIEASIDISTDKTPTVCSRTYRVMKDALKLMEEIGKANRVAVISEMYTKAEYPVGGTKKKLVAPYRDIHFIMADMVDLGDYTDPEFTPTDISFEPRMTLYRVDPSVDMEAYASLKYKDVDPRTGVVSEILFTVESVEELWKDIDTGLTDKEILVKWGIEASTLEYLKKLRFPFIRVLLFDTITNLENYLFSSGHTGYHGILEVYLEKPITQTESEAKCKFYRYLSKREDGTPEYNHLECSWEKIDQWPWELNTDLMLDWNSGRYLSNTSVSMMENTSAVIAHEQGSIITEEGISSDTYEVPIEDLDAESRHLAYNINMLHLDYKLLFSDETSHQTYRESTIETIRSYFTTINETRLRLLEGTNLYFSPIRTMGYAKFKGKNGEYLFCDLSLSIGFRIHAESFISTSPSSKTTIKTNSLTIVDKRIATGTVSLIDMASDIESTMSDMIIYVDVLGINGDQSIQTLFRTDTSSMPHLGYRLVKNENGSISVERNLTLEYSIIR